MTRLAFFLGKPDPMFNRARDRLGHAGGLALFYGCLFAAIGVGTPFFTPWLASRGMTVADIATITAAGAVARMVSTPVCGYLADRHAAHRRLLMSLAFAWTVAWLLVANAAVFWQFLLAQVLVSLTSAALSPLADTLATVAARQHGVDYGRVRLWGSVAFIATSLGAGFLVDRYGIGIVIGLIVALVSITAACTLLLPRDAVPEPNQRRLSLMDAAVLVRAPPFLLFLVAAGLAQASHAMFYTYGTLHWQRLGLTNTWCGVLWAIGVVAEIVLFWFAPVVARRITPLTLLGIGLAAGIVRWTAMGIDPPFALLIPLQVLHGLTFGAAHLGAVQAIAQGLPATHAATAQSLLAVVSGGIGAALATQWAGSLYAVQGGRTYWAMAVLSTVALVALLALFQRRRDGLLSAA